MPTKRIFVLGVMIFVLGSFAKGGAKLWASKTLAEQGDGVKNGVAEVVVML